MTNQNAAPSRLFINTPLPLALCLALALVCLMSSACSGPRVGRVIGDGDVQYDDPTAVETVTQQYGSTDLQSTAEYMTQQLLADPLISNARKKPRLRLREVINYTDEHIDSKGITDKIRVKLMRSKTVRFLADPGNLDQVYEEREFNKEHTKKSSNDKLLDADYIVTGAVRSIRKRTEDMGDVYYQITMELVNPHSGEVVWADETEIRKTTEDPSIGW
ncbi:penicillin-binding protein activator LpoB [Desulfovibrio sp. OttesenSCG-928-G15]|nr:penicillin-binding protein activator LpoB [Desulfovibrio sp. OttesenSCG-928-G15]